MTEPIPDRLNNTFSNYLKREIFKDGIQSLFQEWPFDKVWMDVNRWKIPANYLYIYILANDCNFRTLHAHVGCVADWERRLAMHNGTIPGGPSVTKKASGHWKVVLYVEIPPYRNYSTKLLKNFCKRGRGWTSRCKKAIKMANKRGLKWRITPKIRDSKSHYYSQNVYDMIEKYAASKGLEPDAFFMKS